MPNLIRVFQPYAAGAMYSRVKGAAQAIGEEFIALAMYHVNRDEDTQPRCVCWNPVYNNTQDVNCPDCFGTTFAGGVKEAWRIWGIFTDDDEDESRQKYGVWQDQNHDVQLEPFPDLTQNDYLFRVQQWDSSRGAPLIIDRPFIINNMQYVTVRTGNQFGGNELNRIAQKAKISVLPKEHPINRYDILTNITFPRYDNEPR